MWAASPPILLMLAAGDGGMDAPVTGDTFLFAGFRLDRHGLSRCDNHGCFVPVPLGSRALEVLGVLVAGSGNLVARDEIMNVVWPGVVVESSNLPVQITALRRILDDGQTEGSYIQTVPGRGYRFVASVTQIAAEARTNAPPRLSLVVLPFINLGHDPEQQYFADGITEDLTTNLSRIADMVVISCNTAFTYRDKRADTKQIGRELCVRYVLEGSVRRSGSQVRVSAQLINAETDVHLWAERFDGDTSDLFALQDEIASRIANALGVELVAAEAARRTEHPDALDYILRGRAVMNRPVSPDVLREGISLFEHALTLDPQSVEAQSLLAVALVIRLLDFGSSTYDSDLAQAEELTSKALAMAPRNPLAHFAKAQVLRVQGRVEQAISEYEIVAAYNPNWVEALAAIGRCKAIIGPIEEAIPAQERAIRLSPRDKQIALWYYRIGQAHLLQSRLEEAILWFERARRANSEIPFFHAWLASAYALHGDAEQAAAHLAEAQRLDSLGAFSSIVRQKRQQSLSQGRGARPEIRALAEATYYAGLRKAGMPEE